MKCPHCQTENENTTKYCRSCGAQLSAASNQKTMKAVTSGGLVIGKAARESRIKEIVDPSALIGDRAYNGVIGAMLLWGFLVNYLLCLKYDSIVRIFDEISPIVFLIGYFVLVIGGIIITNKAKNPVITFLGYNLVVVPFGFVISMLVEAYGGIDSNVVTQAFLYTMLISVAMVATAIVFPKFFEKIGTALAAVLLGLIVCEILLLIFGVRQEVTSWIAAGLFSLYIGYDVYRSQMFPRTVKNAIRSALDIYLDIANLFIRLLEIFGKKND